MACHRALGLATLVVALAALAVACGEPGEGPWRGTGSYPIDIMPEMHYNQSHKAQEPPRVPPPPDSIPVTGKELPLPASPADAATLESPLADIGAAEHHRAGVLYHINCSACHGATARGDGPTGLILTEYTTIDPPAFDSERIEALSEGQVFWSITNGVGHMPPFGRLLSPDERWLLAYLAKLSAAERDAILSGTEAPGYLPPGRRE